MLFYLKVYPTYKNAINFYITTIVGGLSDAANRDKKVRLACHRNGLQIAIIVWNNFTITSIFILQSHKVNFSDDLIKSSVSKLHICLKSASDHLVMGSYLIVIQLAVSFKLQPKTWNGIIPILLKVNMFSYC